MTRLNNKHHHPIFRIYILEQMSNTTILRESYDLPNCNRNETIPYLTARTRKNNSTNVILCLVCISYYETYLLRIIGVHYPVHLGTYYLGVSNVVECINHCN